jgi:hypothetical protein
LTEAIAAAGIELTEKAVTRPREKAIIFYISGKPGSEVTGAPGRLCREEERGTKLTAKIRHDWSRRSLHRRYRNRLRWLFDRLRPSRFRPYRRISWRLRLSRLLSHC